MSLKEIAERILEPSEERNSLTWEQIQNLARAYLELEKKHKITDLEVIENLEFELGKSNLNKELINDVSRLDLIQCLLFWKSLIDKVKDESNLEITKLKEELAAEKADKQRVLDIGVKMQREVNDRLEAKNASLIEALRFYADRNNWKCWDTHTDVKDVITISDLSCKSFNVDADFAVPSGGRTAIEALKKWGGV